MKKKIIMLVGVISGAAIAMSGCYTPAPRKQKAATESTVTAEETEKAEEAASPETVTEPETSAQAEVETVPETKPEPVSVSIDDMVTANTSENILKNHKNYKGEIKIVEDKDGKNVKASGYKSLLIYGNSETVYYCKDYTGAEEDDLLIDKILYTKTDEFTQKTYTDNSTVSSKLWYAMNGEEKSNYIPDINKIPFIVSYDDNTNEKISSIEVPGDGTVTLVTTSPVRNNENVVNVPDEWKDGQVEYTYILDSATLEIQKMYSKIVLEDEKIDLCEITAEYDVDEPQDYKEMCDFADTYDIKTKTITIVYDPDTNKEESYTMSTMESNVISLCIKDGYEMYMDKEGTQPFEAPDTNVYTIYAIKK